MRLRCSFAPYPRESTGSDDLYSTLSIPFTFAKGVGGPGRSFESQTMEFQPDATAGGGEKEKKNLPCSPPLFFLHVPLQSPVPFTALTPSLTLTCGGISSPLEHVYIHNALFGEAEKKSRDPTRGL